MSGSKQIMEGYVKVETPASHFTFKMTEKQAQKLVERMSANERQAIEILMTSAGHGPYQTWTDPKGSKRVGWVERFANALKISEADSKELIATMEKQRLLSVDPNSNPPYLIVSVERLGLVGRFIKEEENQKLQDSKSKLRKGS